MEAAPTQEVIKVEPTSSNERVEQLMEGVQTIVHVDHFTETNFTGTSMCSSERHTDELVEPAPTQELMKVEPTGSNERIELLYVNVQAPVHEECSKELNSTGTSICDFECRKIRRAHKCTLCGKTLSSKSNLQRHEKIFHPLTNHPLASLLNALDKPQISQLVPKGKKTYECNICMKRFSQLGNLNKHSRVHIEEKPYECDVCTKTFRRRYELDTHRLVHTGEKPYECEICMVRFRIKRSLKNHRLVHTGEKSYQCDICKKTFNQKTNFDNHKPVHTKEKPYQCTICMKEFSVKSFLNTHKRIHINSRDKPYECEVCMRKFSTLSALKKHGSVHTGEKPYQCEICMKMFRQKNTLNSHRISHWRKTI